MEDIILLLNRSEWTGGGSSRGAYGCTSARSTALERDPNAISEEKTPAKHGCRCLCTQEPGDHYYYYYYDQYRARTVDGIWS